MKGITVARFVGVGVVASGCLIEPAWAGDWFVDVEAPANGDGLLWSTAFNSLPDATSVASPGDFIFVAGGTYRLTSQGSAFTLPDRVSIQGAFRGQNGLPDNANVRDEVSILSADVLGNDDPQDEESDDENAGHVISILSGTGLPPNQTATDFADRANLDRFDVVAGRGFVDGGGVFSTSSAGIVAGDSFFDPRPS